MPAYQHFEELPVWQEAARLYNLVLDLLDAPDLPLSPGFRNQLDRAALSVSNNIAEGFERVTTNELLSFLAIARGSSGEVRSMLAVINNRPRLKRFGAALHHIRGLAESCSRQLTAWTSSIEDSPVQGKRHLTRLTRAAKRTSAAAEDFRNRFLRSLPPDHPLYDTPEARLARGTPRFNP
jgi:four helix bundle protein